MGLDVSFKRKMQVIYDSFTAYDAVQTDRIDRFRNIEPESALFLYSQVKIQKSQNVLEIGTSTGYSTLWIAQALVEQQGKLDTIEIDSKRIDIAQQNAKQLALDHVIHFYLSDALAFLRANQKIYDLILLDAERKDYVDYWPFLAKLLDQEGCVLIVDNVISHADEVKSFKELINQDQRFFSQILNIGAGLMMIMRQ